MRSAKQVRRKAASRKTPKPPVYSTSEARANFATALETAQLEKAVIGFERYGRTIAVLAPTEAVYMLAGRADLVAPSIRRRIASGALQFVRKTDGPEPSAAAPARSQHATSKKNKKKQKKSRA